MDININLPVQPLDIAAAFYANSNNICEFDAKFAFDVVGKFLKFSSALENLIKEHKDIVGKEVKMSWRRGSIPKVTVYGEVTDLGIINTSAGQAYTSICCKNIRCCGEDGSEGKWDNETQFIVYEIENIEVNAGEK